MSSLPFEEDGFVISRNSKKTLSLPIYTEENPIPVLLHAYEEMGSMHWGRLMAFISYVNRHNLSMQEWNVV